jgi:uncharacterized membrane protein YccF (DUF307 family)
MSPIGGCHLAVMFAVFGGFAVIVDWLFSDEVEFVAIIVFLVAASIITTIKNVKYLIFVVKEWRHKKRKRKNSEDIIAGNP